MEAPPVVYNPVNTFGSPVRNRGGMSRNLLVADDHFLVGERVGLNEDYLRIMFKDIRHIVFKRTDPSVILLIFGILLLIGLSPLGIFVLIRYFRNVNSCACYLITDVQTIRVPVPSSYKKMPEFINVLRSQTQLYGKTSFAG